MLKTPKNYITRPKKIAIITGASSGLGAEFALQIDSSEKLDEIWLIARRKKNLEAVAKKLTTPTVILDIDLSKTDSLALLSNRLEKQKPDIRILVNNAGYGAVGYSSEIALKKQVGMVDLNIRALTELTLMSLIYTKKGSRIIQIASSAGFAPMANFNVYAATKAYVIHFSYALAWELRKNRVSVTAVCPGPIKTEFYEVASGNESPRLAADPLEVVKLALSDSKKGRAYSIYGFPIKFYRYMSLFIPDKWIVWFTGKVKFA